MESRYMMKSIKSFFNYLFNTGSKKLSLLEATAHTFVIFLLILVGCIPLILIVGYFIYQLINFPYIFLTLLFILCVLSFYKISKYAKIVNRKLIDFKSIDQTVKNFVYVEQATPQTKLSSFHFAVFLFSSVVIFVAVLAIIGYAIMALIVNFYIFRIVLLILLLCSLVFSSVFVIYKFLQNKDL